MDKLSMKAVMRQTDLTADTIRAWERRYGAVSPARNMAGRRIYSDIEVQRLKLLASLVRDGHAISHIAGLSHEQLLCKAGPWAKKYDIDTNSEVRMFNIINYLKTNKELKLRQELRKIIFEISPKEFVFFFAPNLISFAGELSQKGVLSSCEEHSLSLALGDNLFKIYEDLLQGSSFKDEKGTILLMLPPGETHEFGLLTVGIFCLYKGIKTMYCGADIVLKRLYEIINNLKPSAVLFSSTYISSEEHRLAIVDYLKDLRDNIPSSCAIWIGGPKAFDLAHLRHHPRVRIFESLLEFQQNIK